MQRKKEMAGREYRNFVTNHRSGAKEIGRQDEADRLVVRMREGVGNKMYKDVDYDQMKAIAMEQKFAANKSLMKMQKLAKLSKVNKEQGLLKHHKQAWDKEHNRLITQRRRLELELDDWIRRATAEGSSITMFTLEAEEYALGLSDDLKRFKAATVDPLWMLREDVDGWLEESGEQLRTGTAEARGKHQEIGRTVDSVRAQQAQVVKMLDYEQVSLEAELQKASLQELVHTEQYASEGVPFQAQILECPDSELKVHVLNEFLVLDKKYKDKLRELDKAHALVSLDKEGWSEEDHALFLAVLDQYPRDMANRRQLYLDRLRRQLPQKTRHQLVMHEEWVTAYKYYHERRRILIGCWIHDRRELQTKVAAIFADACLSHELHTLAAINRQRQEQICQDLYQRVATWREAKFEAMRLQEDLDHKLSEQREREMALQAQKEREKRATEKEKIQAFHDKQEAQRKQKEEATRKKLEALQKQLSEQAFFDRERVKYREDLLAQRREVEDVAKQRLVEQEQEKQRRLDALRQQVEVNVEDDPLRLFQDTVSTKARLGQGLGEEDVNIQRPLFEVKGFSGDQIAADPRLKVEQALRTAGLHENPYARQLLAKVQPPTKPRPDQHSSLFKQN